MAAQLSLVDIYCIDSSALIDFWDEEYGTYPKDVLEPVWEHIEGLVARQQLISCQDVYQELRDDLNDDFRRWIRVNKHIFTEVDDDQVACVQKIFDKYQPLALGPKDTADPFIIALAMSRGGIVISSEKKTGLTQIPNICKEFGVRCVNIMGFCRREGLKLQLGS